MKIEDVYKKEINDLMIGRGCTKFHITGIRHCDFKDKADEFIEEAAKRMLNVSFFQEKANPYDHEAVSCRHGRKQIGYVTTYDLEKYYILAGKDSADHLTGHFGRFSANIEDHLLKLYVPGSITLDDISEYRKKLNNQKDKLYGSWKHDAIDQYLVHSRHQNEAIACISQLKEHVLMLYGAQGTSTRGDLMPLLQDYKDCSQYDISLEGQQDRWDILLYLDCLHDFNHRPGLSRDDFFESILKDVEDVISQIGGELVRSVSYKSYIERLTELVSTDLPSSEAAQLYLKTLPNKAFDDIRQQVESFPHHLYHLFHTNPEEFVRALYYARIPRKYLDPFLSGIALVEAYDNLSDGKTTEITITNNNVNMGGLIRYDSDETREEYARRMNNTIREYNKMALDILKRNVPAEIEGLLEYIEKGEWMLHFDKKIVKEFDYTYINNNGVERKIHGPWDYETYCEVFEKPSCRKQIEEMLKKEPYKKQDVLIEEYEIQCLHSALKTELAQAQKVDAIKKRARDRVTDDTPKRRLRTTKFKTESIKKIPTDKPKTLKYFKHGDNGFLRMQTICVHLVYKKWCEWKWINHNTSYNASFDDFKSFFEGDPKHCNIEWTGPNTTILTILLQELLKQPYIEKQTGISAKSLVSKQFKARSNYDRNRLDKVADERIRITLFILNPENMQLLKHDAYEEVEEENISSYDLTDAEIKAYISSGGVSVGKSV